MSNRRWIDKVIDKTCAFPCVVRTPNILPVETKSNQIVSFGVCRCVAMLLVSLHQNIRFTEYFRVSLKRCTFFESESTMEMREEKINKFT